MIDYKSSKYEPKISDFCNRLSPVGRILELEGWHVWCCSPIYGEDGKVHVFFSRWPYETKHEGWLTHCEIAHAVADEPKGPYKVTGSVLKGRGGNYWDAATIHNPTIHKKDGKYYLFYLGNSDGTPDTQRIGLAVAESLYGPWKRVGDGPILDVSENKMAWDSYITTNPAFLEYSGGRCLLYYKAWDRYNDNLRKMGVAVSDNIEGPYTKYEGNPIIDYSEAGSQVEDAYIFMENGKFHMIMRDFGVFSNRSGLYCVSDDGFHWSQPMVGYHSSDEYFGGQIQRFERPQILMNDGKPEYLFLALAGGRAGTSSGAVLKINTP